MQFDIKNIFLVTGLIQGLIVVFFSLIKGSSPSKFLFSGIIFIFCLSIFNNLRFYFVTESEEVLITNFLIWEPITLIGPLTFFYLKSLFEKNFAFKKVYYFHFIPVILELFPSILALYLWIFVAHPELSFLNNYDDFIVLPQVISFTIYLTLSWKYLFKNRPLSDLKTFKWTRDFLIGISVLDLIWIPFIALYLTNQVWLIDSVFFYPLFYPMVFFLYFLGIRTMMTNLSFRPNPYSSQEIERYLSLIENALEKEKLYTKCDLNLKALSDHASIPIKTLSFVLNHILRKGFNEFINEYRVKAALSKIKNGDVSKVTLEGIAFEVGFSSRSTFYRAFKQVTGKPPTDYLEK